MNRGVREPAAPFYGPVVREQRISLSLIEMPKTRNLIAPREVGIAACEALPHVHQFLLRNFSASASDLTYFGKKTCGYDRDFVKKNTIFARRPVDSPEHRWIHCPLKKIDKRKLRPQLRAP
jgi:hypothetical protein